MNAMLEIGLSNALMTLGLAIVAAAATLVRKSPPALVHALWLLVFVKLLTPPLVAVPVPLLFERLDGLIMRARPSEAAEPGPADGNAVVSSDQMGGSFDRYDGSAALELDLGTRSGPDAAPALHPHDALPPATSRLDESIATSRPPAVPGASRVRGIVISAWLAGSLIWLGVSAASAWRVCRLLTFARPAPPALREEVRRLARRLKMARCPEVLVVSGRVSPMVWPIGRGARILLPTDLLERLIPEERSTVLAHELAHVRRRDHWIRLVELACTVLYWWHPVVWWARSQLRRAEEECCDAWVVATLPDSAQSYAAALLKTVDLCSQWPQRGAIPDAIGSGARTTHLLERRLTMIYRQCTPPRLGPAWRVFLVLLAVIALPIVPGRATPSTPEPDARETSARSDASAPAGTSAEEANADSPQAAAAGEPFRLVDNFDGRLDLDWEVIRPDPTHVSFTKTPGRLTITSQLGGLFGGREHGAGNNIYMIANPAGGDGDFVVTTCLEQFHPREPFQQAGPHIYDDDDNYLKAIIARSERNVLIGSSWETRGVFGGRDQIAEDIEWDRLWLRIIKRGRAYESSYSLDGKEYTVIAERIWGDGSPREIGLAVMNEDGTSSPLDAAFDFFEVRSLTDEEKNDPVYLERCKLQGTWEVVSSRLGGKALDESPLTRFEFHGIEVTFSEKGQRITSKYAPHPDREPKELALTGLGRDLWTNHTRAFWQDGNLTSAVYSIEPERLVICMDLRPGAPAPTELETKEGDGRLLVDLRRMPEAVIAAIRRNARSAKELVDWLDVDRDGQLTLEEFTSDWPTPAAIDRAREVFGLVDRDKDGRVTLSEYQKKSNKADFLLLDVDQDDRLTPTEASAGSLVRGFSPDRAQALFNVIDKDDDGSLDLEEYTAPRSQKFWFARTDRDNDDRLSFSEYASVNPALVRTGRVQRVFGALDRDGDGSLPFEEFAHKPHEVAFAKSDVDADGKLSFQEFAAWKTTAEALAAAKEVFARKDSDDDGSLSFKEYTFRGEDEEFWKADRNGDNRVDRREFDLSRMGTTTGDAPAAFGSFDRNRDDTISLSEFQRRPD